MKPLLSKALPRVLPALLGLAVAGCAVQSGPDPVLEVREKELKATRDTVAQLKKELEAFQLDRESIANSLRSELQGGSRKELDALNAKLTERDQQIAELRKAMANAPAAGGKPEMATVTFTSGRTTTCQVLAYKDSKLTVKLPSGQVTQAGLSGIQSIEWPGAAEAGPSSTGNDGGGQSSIADPSSPFTPPPAVVTSPAPAPAPVLPVAPATPAPADPSASRGVSLSPAWKSPVPGASIQVKELASLLREHADRNFDPAPVSGITLLEGVSYLMPADQVFKSLNARRTPKRMINVSGFPKASFFYYEIPGEFEGGYNTLVLITDMADQTMAVQLSDGKGGSRVNYFSSTTSAFNTYNFVMGRKKANAEWVVYNRVHSEGPVVTIDSELAEQYYRLKERNRLILPKPVANLLLVLSDLY